MSSSSDMPISKMKVVDLKRICKERGLPSSGCKSDLLERLNKLDNEDICDDSLLGDDTEIGDEEQLDVSELDAILTPDKENGSQDEDSTSLKKAEVAIKLKDQTNGGGDVIEIKELSEEERRKKRAEKYGIVSDNDVKALRAKRFGITNANTSTEVNTDILKKRAERFGCITSSVLNRTDEEQKKLKRLERFGSQGHEDDAKKKARAEKFGTDKVTKVNTVSSIGGNSDLADKKNARLARFGIDSSLEAKKAKRAAKFLLA